METDAQRQGRLAEAVAANRAGSVTPHVVVVLPAFSLAESLLAHYATRLGAYEHRYLLATLMIPRIPGCELVFVTCQAPEPEVLDYYDRLGSPGRPGACWSGCTSWRSTTTHRARCRPSSWTVLISSTGWAA